MKALSASEKQTLVNGISGRAGEDLQSTWILNARDDQLPPETHCEEANWLVWLLLGGRGSGKTRSGAEWVRAQAMGNLSFGYTPARRIALVGPTFAEARSVMVEGVSGVLAVHPDHERPKFEASLKRLHWPNGAMAQLFSAEEPDSLRGPQFDAAWCDELCKWKYAERTWDMLQFGLRLGVNPRQVVTTTPRPVPLLKKLLEADGTVVSKSRTYANAENLSQAFLKSITERYGGTRLGRQELEAELLDDNPDGLWQREALERLRLYRLPALVRIVVAIDPPATSGERANSCGIIAAGLSEDGRAIVLEDATLVKARPMDWARHAVALYHKLAADRLVAEINQGGEMVTQVIRQADPNVPVKMVRATRGKHVRAEPVAALYERGRVLHLGSLPHLEDEMCNFEPILARSGTSPDRLDALVWALTDLMLTGEAGKPRIREI